MNLRIAFAAVLVMIAVVVWLRDGSDDDDSESPSADGRVRQSNAADAMAAGGSPDRRFRSSDREERGPRATHGAHQLRDFHIGPLEIAGLSLEEALQTVRAAYEDACLISGEVPLRITFQLPRGKSHPLTLKLQGQTMDSGIRLLAAMSGMNVRRDGSSYHFSVPPDLARSADIPLPGSFADALRKFAGVGSETADVMELLSAMGLSLSPDTSATPDGRTLTTRNAADHAALAALIDLVEKHQPVQHDIQTKFIKLPADSAWKMPDVANMTAEETQILMRGFAQAAGIELMTAPSITSRGGSDAKIEIVRELIVPNDENGGFVSHQVGLVIDSLASPLAFGSASDLRVKDTTADFDPATGKFEFNDRLNISESFYTKSADTRLMLETHPDGSRTLVLVTTTLIDPTGKPR